MSNIVFEGPFKQEIQDFISLKRSIGYKYLTEAGILKRFDLFLAENHPDATEMTKEAITGWCAKTMHETAANHCSRASAIRQFTKYLDSIGINTWILPNNYYPVGQQYVPHIYTPDELSRFFKETDKCQPRLEAPYRHFIMPVFFRLLFSCGLRCSEARLLKVEDVDLSSRVLSVVDSKNHNSRLVPMPNSITQRLVAYAEKVHPFPNSERYFFPALNEKPMSLSNVL